MTPPPTPQPIRPPDPDDERERRFWLAMRRALMAATKAIEERYDVSSDDKRRRVA